MHTSGNGTDIDVLCSIITMHFRTCDNPDGDYLTFKRLINDIGKTIIENRAVEQKLYYGRD